MKKSRKTTYMKPNGRMFVKITDFNEMREDFIVVFECVVNEVGAIIA